MVKMKTVQKPAPESSPQWKVGVEAIAGGGVGLVYSAATPQTQDLIRAAVSRSPAELLAKIKQVADEHDAGPAGEALRTARARAASGRELLDADQAELRRLEAEQQEEFRADVEAEIVTITARLDVRRKRAADAAVQEKAVADALAKSRYAHLREQLAPIRTEVEVRRMAAEKRLADAIPHDDLIEYLAATTSAEYAGSPIEVLADAAKVERPPAKPQVPPLPPRGPAPAIYQNSGGEIAGFIPVDEEPAVG
jgi:hypothetical protein